MVDQSMAGLVGSRFANGANSVSDLTISWCLLVEKDVEDFCWVQCSYANATIVIFDGKAFRAQKMWFEWENKHCTILRWAKELRLSRSLSSKITEEKITMWPIVTGHFATTSVFSKTYINKLVFASFKVFCPTGYYFSVHCKTGAYKFTSDGRR